MTTRRYDHQNILDLARELFVAGYDPDAMPVGVKAGYREAERYAKLAFLAASAFGIVSDQWLGGGLDALVTDINGDPIHRNAPPNRAGHDKGGRS